MARPRVFSDEERKARKKERQQNYRSRPEVNRLKEKELQKTPENKTKTKKIRADKRLKVLQHYSKLLSDNNTPCCNCCNTNSHIEFLAIDHIAGKKEMDSEPELVKLGYSSKFKGGKLHKFILDNNFPKGFQILCHNCNFAKGHSKDGLCPHERK